MNIIFQKEKEKKIFIFLINIINTFNFIKYDMIFNLLEKLIVLKIFKESFFLIIQLDFPLISVNYFTFNYKNSKIIKFFGKKLKLNI